MNKWQIIYPLVAMLVAVIIVGSIHLRGERRAMVSAIIKQLDGHAPRIGELLATMHGSNVTIIEDLAYRELKAIPSTSLISRSMIRVVPTADGFLERVIDTSSFDIAPRTLRASRPVAPK